jgi:hypothetical protein
MARIASRIIPRRLGGIAHCVTSTTEMVWIVGEKTEIFWPGDTMRNWTRLGTRSASEAVAVGALSIEKKQAADAATRIWKVCAPNALEAAEVEVVATTTLFIAPGLAL